MQTYKVSFSNQKIEGHISGEILVQAASAKKAINIAGSIVSVPGGAFFLAQSIEDLKKAA